MDENDSPLLGVSYKYYQYCPKCFCIENLEWKVHRYCMKCFLAGCEVSLEELTDDAKESSKNTNFSLVVHSSNIISAWSALKQLNCFFHSCLMK